MLTLVGCPKQKVDKEKSNKRLDLAIDALGRGNLDEAEMEANKSLGFNPRNEVAYNVLGLVHHYRAAADEMTVAVNDCLTGLDSEAMHSDQEEEYVEADKAFTRATELAPDYGDAWSGRGITANLMGRYDDAVTYLEEALQHPERLVNASLTRAHLGWAHFYREDYVAATKELLQALQFSPGMCVASYRLGRVYFAREEWEKAAEQFQGVSDDPACQLQEGSLYLMKSRIEQGLIDDAAAARDACLARNSKSCIAVECRAEGSAL